MSCSQDVHEGRGGASGNQPERRDHDLRNHLLMGPTASGPNGQARTSKASAQVSADCRGEFASNFEDNRLSGPNVSTRCREPALGKDFPGLESQSGMELRYPSFLLTGFSATIYNITVAAALGLVVARYEHSPAGGSYIWSRAGTPIIVFARRAR
ncbi:hypothetical protein C8F01DRAFT_1082761 [Mycena amicta]|nr:hypothetical protein C8F01DRAFT_1082761 [Mycena amicta]